MFVCIARTQVEWPALLEGARRALGRSITTSLDKERLPSVGVPSFVCAVAEFAKPGGQVGIQMRAGNFKHAMFTFIINMPRDEFLSLASFGLVVTPADLGDFAIVSGRLADWVHAVVECTQVKELRKFGCLMLAWFEVESLGEAWGSWEKDHIASERLYRLVKK